MEIIKGKEINQKQLISQNFDRTQEF